MKRILSMLLALTLVLSLAACGKKDDGVLVPPSTEPSAAEPAETKPVETKPVETEPNVDTAGAKNTHWTSVLENKEFVLDLSSASLKSEMFEVAVLTDSAGNKICSLSLDTDGVLSKVDLYQIGEKYYYNEIGNDGTETTSQWYNIANDEGVDMLHDTDSYFMGAPQNIIDNLQVVEYSHTEDGLDFLNASYLDPLRLTFHDDAEPTTIYDADLEFELNGEIGEFSYQVNTYPEAGGVGYGRNTTWDLDVFDNGAEFDEDSLILTLGDGTEILCTEKEVRISKSDVDPIQLPTHEPIDFTMIVDPATNKIEGFEVERNGQTSVFAAMQEDDISTYIPENIADAEVVTGETVREKLANMMMSLLFAGLYS